MKLNYQNMLNTPKTGIQITENEMKMQFAKVQNIIEALNHGEGDNQDKGVPMLGWQTYARDITPAEIQKIQDAARNLADKCDVVFIIGIGGSYLGPKAVIEAVYGKNYNDVLKTKLYFIGCDTDPDFYAHCLKIGEDKNCGVVVISKSGTTTEPALAFRFIKRLIEQRQGKNAKDFIIAVTDAKKGALRQLADGEGYATFVIPDNIGGRFSVVTPVGLAPIAIAGIDIAEYLSGYKKALPLIDNPDAEKNPAALYALLRFLAWQKGAAAEYQVTNSAFFESNLAWTMQLEPESEGHYGHGLHVVPAVFPRDLHSIGQLIQQGPRDLIEIATKILTPRADLPVPLYADDTDELNYIPQNKLTLNDINKMTIDGPLAAHYADGVPNMTIELEKITPQNLGEYHYLLMKATAIQGYLLGHNPFVQPGVQFWKDKLFKLAGKPGY
ncbi:glucose-6-phosphate isomerase [Candidatus Termititenax aidoneus]|uniref:Glucose-6-phosphate isomerase n=1 Tax=Termititenax aidoneus TaxID=2218524 RepID=A0A388TCZ9_TERA1|nr:glucose-6-phosphate isomerase [Candidatus Termititenax aidoneus]